MTQSVPEDLAESARWERLKRPGQRRPTDEYSIQAAASPSSQPEEPESDEVEVLTLHLEGYVSDEVWATAMPAAREQAAYERGVAEGLRRADNAITWGTTCLGCADKLDGLITERAAGYAEGVTEGRRQATEAVRAQAALPDLVHFDRPSDFRKGVLTCLAALEALATKTTEEAPDA